jgi:hypothetical protein
MYTPRPFFKISKDACGQITETFDFFTPTAVALWNLRWQVIGFTEAIGRVDEAELQKRFVAGSGIRGATLRYACLETTWGQQKTLFARYLLFSLFSIYESWIKEILESLGPDFGKYEKSLQFPGPKGAADALKKITSKQSGIGKAVFQPALLKNPRADLSFLENRLRCYRVFKEIRNSFIHGGGRTEQALVDSFAEYAANVNKPGDLGVTELPQLPSIALNGQLDLSLRGVIGFSEIILNLILTLEAEFVVLDAAERELLTRWKPSLVRKDKKRFLFKSTQLKREAQLQSRLNGIGLPEAQSLPLLDSFLKKNGCLPH